MLTVLGVMDKEVQIDWTEMLALEESIYFAQSKGWNKMELETDCANLVNRYNKRDSDLTTFGHRMREIHMKLDAFNCFILSGLRDVVIKLRISFVSWL